VSLEQKDLKRAMELWRDAYRHQIEGDLDRAIELYRKSIDAYPTAEAHTFLGWAMSFRGHLDEATQECLRAIEIDPDFGNPYNDIGVYLMRTASATAAWSHSPTCRTSTASTSRLWI
jgi:tetratricopeptide (TPR) repeat protein